MLKFKLINDHKKINFYTRKKFQTELGRQSFGYLFLRGVYNVIQILIKDDVKVLSHDL